MEKLSLTYSQLIQLCQKAGKDPREFFDGVLVDEATMALSQLKSQQETQIEIENKKREAFSQWKVRVSFSIQEATDTLTTDGDLFGESPPNLDGQITQFMDSVESLLFPVESKGKNNRSRTKVYVDGVHLPWRNDGANKFNPWYQICEMIPNLGTMPIYHIKLDGLKSHLIRYLPGVSEFNNKSDDEFYQYLSNLIGKKIEVR